MLIAIFYTSINFSYNEGEIEMIEPKLYTLLKVYETKSFTKAAQMLNLTQPAVSQHIKSIEDELGIKIFNRTQNDLKLTPEGEIIIKYARRMTTLYKNLQVAIEDAKKQVKRVVVGVTPTVENNFIMSYVFSKYLNSKDNVHIRIISDSIKNLYSKLKTYEIDFAIVDGKMRDQDFASLLLDTDYLVLAVANDNPLSKKSIVNLLDLRKEKFILRLPGSGTRSLFEAHLQTNNLSIEDYNVVFEADNISTIKDLVSKNVGVSILAKSACLEDVSSKKFKIIQIENVSMLREINIIYHHDFPHTDMIKDIVDIYNDSIKIYQG